MVTKRHTYEANVAPLILRKLGWHGWLVTESHRQHQDERSGNGVNITAVISGYEHGRRPIQDKNGMQLQNLTKEVQGHMGGFMSHMYEGHHLLYKQRLRV